MTISLDIAETVSNSKDVEHGSIKKCFGVLSEALWLFVKEWSVSSERRKHMEEITTGLKICPKCRHLMVIKNGNVRCPKCDRKEIEEELRERTKRIGEGISRRSLKKKKEITYTGPFEHCNKVYLMFRAKSEEHPYRKADVMTFPLDTPITEIDQKCKEWAGKGIGSWVLLCIA